MFSPLIELLLKHHPASFIYHQPSGQDCFEHLERHKSPPPDMPYLADYDVRARLPLENAALALAALALVGFFALMAAGEFTPPPATTVADLPPIER